MQDKSIFHIFIFTLTISVLLLAGFYFIPWQNISWGKVELLPASTITVTGEAETKEKNQVASFTAGVSVINDNKDTAVAEVNQKIQSLITAVKTFGIAETDLKTQNLSVYQTEETYYEDGRQKQRPGQWRVSNNVEIKLRNVDQAGELANLLTQSGATNVYGPNFTLDDTKQQEIELLDEAIKNAQDKAARAAQASGKTLGKMINIAEGSQTQPLLKSMMGAGGGGGEMQPGTGTVYKTVTVTFELR